MKESMRHKPAKIRKNISITKAEMERLNTKNKLTTWNNNNNNNNNQDIININAAIEQLMKQNDVNNAPDPAQNPFLFLWLANCVICSVVVAFLVLKGWKKKVNSGTKAMKSPDERMKEIYEAQAGEIRKNISIAAAEIERLRANRKRTRIKVRRTELNS